METMNKYFSRTLGFTAILLAALVSGCSDGGSGGAANGPTVTATYPATSATAVPMNSNVTATFSEAMDAATIDSVSFTVQGANESALTGDVTLDAASNTAKFNPTSNFTASTVYTATITTAAKSTAGKALASNYVWTFTSGTTTDSTAPTVSSTNPLDAATGVALNRSITALFSEAVDPTSVNTTSFILAAGTTSISGTVSYADKLVTFKPASNLAANTEYTATLTTAIKDFANNTLAANKVWTFTTGTASAIAKGPARVNLLTAGDFAILAKTAISKTDTAGTAIIGDLGISPAALSFITGFSTTLVSTYATSTFVTGKIYAADMAVPTPAKMTAAISDMVIAYNDAAGRTTPDFTELHAGKIGGQTLVPGLYKWGTNVWIDSGTNVTLNGGANDVWIFQISGDIIQAADTNVLLTGGALAKNVFWQVAGGTGVAINTNATFEGVILATKAITVNTGASVNGRLLSQTAVTLDANPVTEK